MHGANHGLVDWDDPRSWDQQQAFEAVRRLCATGTTEVPVYDISTSSRLGSRVMDLGDEERFVAEGIFAPEIVAACQREGLLLAAYCITQHPLRTFRRRLVRDLRERRKPPLVLLRRGLALLRGQRAVVAHARTRGCTVATSDEAFSQLRASTPVNAPIAGRDSGTLPP